MLKFGILGCGGIAHTHGHAAKESDRDFGFVACCDVVEDKARQWADKFGAERVYTDYGRMLEAEKLDGLLIATWPVQHCGHVLTALAAGVKNILCEKALTLTGAEAMEMWEKADSAGATLIEGYMYRHHPAIAKVESILAGGEMGPVDNVRAVFHIADAEKPSADDDRRDWRQKVECGGGVPYDLACYCVNACSHFAGGLPISVSAKGEASAKYGTLARLYAIVEYDSGVVGIVQSSKSADMCQELEITCRGGRIQLPIAWAILDKVTVTERRAKGWTEFDVREHPLAKTNSYRLQLDNFADVAAGAARPVMPLAETVANVIVTEAMVASAAERRPVRIELPDPIRRAMEEREEN